MLATFTKYFLSAPPSFQISGPDTVYEGDNINLTCQAGPSFPGKTIRVNLTFTTRHLDLRDWSQLEREYWRERDKNKWAISSRFWRRWDGGKVLSDSHGNWFILYFDLTTKHCATKYHRLNVGRWALLLVLENSLIREHQRLRVTHSLLQVTILLFSFI